MPVGASSGAVGLLGKASGALDRLGLRAARGVVNAGRRLPMSPAAMKRGRTLAGDVVKVGDFMGRHKRATGGTIVGLTGLGGASAARGRRGSQNYPMY